MTDVRAAETALRDAASAAVGARDATAACGVVDTAVSDATPLAAARSALRHLAALLDALPEDGNALLEAVALHTVEALRPRVASLEDADYRFRQLLWQVYWGAEDYLRAGGALAPAHVDSAALALSDAERSSAFLRVAQAYLKADDDVSAERFIQRAAEWVHKSGVPWGVLVQYKTAWAQVLDAKRRFLEAALRYIEIARMPVEQLDAKELLVMLERATRCAVLAPAGPPRARVMAALVRDERIGEIDVSGWGMGWGWGGVLGGWGGGGCVRMRQVGEASPTCHWVWRAQVWGTSRETAGYHPPPHAPTSCAYSPRSLPPILLSRAHCRCCRTCLRSASSLQTTRACLRPRSCHTSAPRVQTAPLCSLARCRSTMSLLLRASTRTSRLRRSASSWACHRQRCVRGVAEGWLCVVPVSVAGGVAAPHTTHDFSPTPTLTGGAHRSAHGPREAPRRDDRPGRRFSRFRSSAGGACHRVWGGSSGGRRHRLG